jgi:single-stranded-DNA-specific exonuclease
MQKRWVERDLENPEMVAGLQAALNIDKVLTTLLLKRGIQNFNQARDFFRPELSHLHDPFLMQDMGKAVSRIEKAIALGEKILVYGDYDVDGTTSVALVYGFFKKYHPLIDFYIPDRYKEGYGISTQGIDYAAAENFSLIIALDCGIKSVDKIEYASSKGVDFIICDHHLPGDTLPKAVAVLDPKRADCNYPYKELSGCGIGFKLVQAYAQKNDIPFDDILCFLDLVMVSIASDIVHITGENRVLAWHGLKRLNTDPCKGLSALIDIAGRKDSYNITDVVFMIGPRINAAGRIGDAKHAVSLLIAESEDSALAKGKDIDLKNQERRVHDSSITEQALALIDNNEKLRSQKTTVVFNEGWHKGVIGIVASRLTEKYYRPTIVLMQSNGVISGSARSVPGFDLYEALSECKDLLLQFGGHKYAAGLTMIPENLGAFQQRFEEVVSATIAEELLIPAVHIDSVLEFKQIDGRFFRILNQFAPFGPENLAPVFVSRNVFVQGQASLVGANHLKMCIRQHDSTFIESIAFGLAEHMDLINKGTRFDVCYTIEENVYKSKRSLQLNVKAINLN